MPQLDRSDKWFARISLPHQILKEKVRQLDWIDVKRLIVVTHVGEKTEVQHCHFCVELKTGNTLQKQSLLARINRVYGVKGNGQVSAKSWDGNSDACSYLFHDPVAEIIYNRGYTDDEIEQFKKRNELVQKVVEENKKRASGRCVTRALAAITAGELDRDCYAIAKYIFRLIRDGEMYECGDFMVKRYVEEIISKSLDGEDWHRYAESRARKLYGEYT